MAVNNLSSNPEEANGKELSSSPSGDILVGTQPATFAAALSLICVRFIHTKYIDCLCLFIALSVLIELWHCTDTIEPRSNEPQSNEIRDSTKFLLSPYPASIEDNVFYLSI